MHYPELFISSKANVFTSIIVITKTIKFQLYTCTVISEDDKNDSARNCLQTKTNLKQGAHVHQPTVWTVPHACTQPYHPGSGSQTAWGSSIWHSTPLSASSTQHILELLAGNRTAVLPRHAQGRRIRGYPDLCVNKGETAVHGCHCQGDMAVRMREVLARPWVCVCVPLALSLSSCKTSDYRKVHKSYLLILHFFLSLRLRSHATG